MTVSHKASPALDMENLIAIPYFHQSAPLNSGRQFHFTFCALISAGKCLSVEKNVPSKIFLSKKKPVGMTPFSKSHFDSNISKPTEQHTVAGQEKKYCPCLPSCTSGAKSKNSTHYKIFKHSEATIVTKKHGIMRRITTGAFH